MDAGSKSSYEFSEFVISSSSAHKLRLVIIYRPPYSSEHKVSSSVFFTQFSKYMESLLLCKEALVICGDFNYFFNPGMSLSIFLVISGFFEYTRNSNSSRRDLVFNAIETPLLSSPLVYGWCRRGYIFCVPDEWVTCSRFVQNLKLNWMISDGATWDVNTVSLFTTYPIIWLEAFFVSHAVFVVMWS